MWKERFTQQLLRKLDVPARRRETELEPGQRRRGRCELEAPIDIPNWLTRGKVLDFQKDRTQQVPDAIDMA